MPPPDSHFPRATDGSLAGRSELQAPSALTNLEAMAGEHHIYLELVLSRATTPARDWLLQRAGRLAAGDVAVSFSGCGRRLGSDFRRIATDLPVAEGEAPNAEVAVAVDAERFWSRFLEILATYP